jgi:hypothetical protein
MFSEYQNYIPSINQTMIDTLVIKNDLSKVLHGSIIKSESVKGTKANSIASGDGIMIRDNN